MLRCGYNANDTEWAYSHMQRSAEDEVLEILLQRKAFRQRQSTMGLIVVKFLDYYAGHKALYLYPKLTSLLPKPSRQHTN